MPQNGQVHCESSVLLSFVTSLSSLESQKGRLQLMEHQKLIIFWCLHDF